ncbi:MAG: hypothetical protein ACRC62_06795 [Microcoleus sp.]
MQTPKQIFSINYFTSIRSIHTQANFLLQFSESSSIDSQLSTY